MSNNPSDNNNTSEFFDNPELSQTPTPNNNKLSKETLNKKRLIIQKQLRAIMSRVNQYQIEKKLASKDQKQQHHLFKKVNAKQKTLFKHLEPTSMINLKPLKKQPFNKLRDLTTSPKVISRIHLRSNSQKSTELALLSRQTKLKSTYEGQKYINYLPQIDFKTPLPRKRPDENKKKQKLMNYLQKAQQYEKDAIRKIGEINRGKDQLNYLQYLKVESQVDDVFINCLKYRVQCALKM